jgi:acyl carrier protein
MLAKSAEQILMSQLNGIAPEIELEIEIVDRDADIREEFGMDSMDFLNLVTALSKQINLEMPEDDYQQMTSFNALLKYLEERSTIA